MTSGKLFGYKIFEKHFETLVIEEKQHFIRYAVSGHSYVIVLYYYIHLAESSSQESLKTSAFSP